MFKASKILFLFLVFLFCMSFISAWSWDNVKDYDKETKTIKIKSSILGIPFLELDDVAKIKLNTGLDVRLPRGYRMFAEFDLYHYKDDNGFLDEMKYYDKNNNMQEVTRQIDYKVKSTKIISIPDYENWELVGYHDEEVEDWIPLEDYNITKNEKITIGVFTEVKKGDIIEWIPTWYGVEIDEWAVWTEGLNADLISFWSFNGKSINDSLGINNGTLSGNAFIDQNASSGIINDTLFVEGSNSNLDVGNDASLDLNRPFSISMWINITTITARGVPIGDTSGGTGGFDIRLASSAAQIDLVKYDVATQIASFPFTLVTGQWYHIVAVQGTARVEYFLDGVNFANVSNAAAFVDSGAALTIGSTSAGDSQDFIGKIDEVGWWNRSLTASEISDLYNGGAGITFKDDFAPTVTLNTPVEDSNFTSSPQEIDFNCSATDSSNLLNISLIINNVINETIINSTSSNSINFFKPINITDGDYNWSCNVTNINNVEGESETRTFSIDTTPNITFTDPTPVQGANLTINSFQVNVTLTETLFQNITFKLFNASFFNINSTTFTDSTRIFNFSDLSDGDYTYNVTTETTTGRKNTTETRSITIVASPPQINLFEPSGQIPSHVFGNNLTVNWSVSDPNGLGECILIYNNVNTSVNCLANNFSFIPVVDVNNISLFANDSFGNSITNTTFWNYKIVEINQTFNNQTTEGSTETFLATIFLNSSFTINSVNFNYNNNVSIAQSFASGDNIILRKADFLVPNVATETNLSFFFEITLSDSTQINLTTQNQTVFNLGIDNCSSFSNQLLNLTSVDEELQTILPNATIEVAVNIFSEDRSTTIVNSSSINENINPLGICLNRNISGSTIYSMDTIIRYEDTNHANEYYNIVDFILSNSSTTQNIILFDLNISDSTEFQLTFTGSDFLPVENALVNVDRQYISENQFKTVELPKTDFNGQAVLHLVRNNVVYNMRIIKDGIVLGNFENLVAFCQDFTIGDCKIELNAFDSVEAIFNYNEDLGLTFNNPTFNETTRIVSFNFITTDGTAKKVNLSVTRNDIFGNRSICSSSLVSAGGTLTCSIDPNIDDSTLNIEVFTNDIPTVKGNVELDTTNFGSGGYLVMFLMTMSLILLFSDSKTGVLFGVGLGFAGSIGMGLRSGDLLGIGASGLALLIVLFIGIWKLNAERQA